MPRKKSKVTVNQKQGVKIHIDLSKKSTPRRTKEVIQRPLYSVSQLPQQTVHQPDHGILYNILQQVSDKKRSNLGTLTESHQPLNELEKSIVHGSRKAQEEEGDAQQHSLEDDVLSDIDVDVDVIIVVIIVLNVIGIIRSSTPTVVFSVCITTTTITSAITTIVLPCTR